MAIKYLWDTNTVIYYLQNHLPPAQERLIDEIINHHKPAISVITEIELLCWKSASTEDINLLKNFISDASVFELDQNIKPDVIAIRKQFNIKLPDAIIAATASRNDLVLISHNFKDFKKIPSLNFIDPFDISETDL